MGVAPRADGGLFVGRDTELSVLLAAVERAAAGGGAFVLVRGEAGIGKSRTVRVVMSAARERGFAIGIGHCVDRGGAPAWWPWTEALRQAAPGSDLDDPEHTAPRDASDGELDRYRLFAHVDDVLGRAAHERPVLLVLEDLHWADLDSIRLLHYIARRIDGRRCLLLGTLREGEVLAPRLARVLADTARAGRSVTLGPLAEAAVAQLVASTGAEPRPDLVRAALDRSGGNPLYLCELLALLGATGRALSVESLASAAVPPLLQELLARPLDHVSKDTTRLLPRAALLGDPFQMAELAAIAELDPTDVLTALDEARRARLIEPAPGGPGRFRFSHALVRDALVDRLPLDERAAWHATVAAYLESTGRDRGEAELGRLAEHTRGSASPGAAARTVEYARAAAERARESRAPAQAAHHLRMALGSLSGVEEPAEAIAYRRCSLLLALADACSQTGERDEAQAAYGEAARLADELGAPKELARAAIGMVGGDEAARAVPDETLRWIERALRGPLPDESALRVALLSTAAHVAYSRGEWEPCEAHAREALRVAERVGRADSWVIASVALHQAIWLPERLEERLALSERMLDTALHSGSWRGELYARQRRITDLLQAGDVAAADEHLHPFEVLAQHVGHPAFRWHATSLAAARQLRIGQLDRADALVHAAFQQGREAGSPNAAALFAVQLFHLRRDQGRLAELLPAVQDLVVASPQIPALTLLLPLIQMEMGDDAPARTGFEAVAARGFDDVPRNAEWLPVMAASAQLAAHLRDRARCVRLHEVLRPFADLSLVSAYGQYWGGSVARPLALLESVLGFADAAREHFAQAIACHRRAGAVPLLAHTLREQAGFQSEQGDTAAAEASLREACALYRSMRTPAFVARCEAALAALAAAGPSAPAEALHAPRRARFEREGARWAIEFEGRRAWVEHRKGMSDLAQLLASPGREVHVLDLMAPAGAGAVTAAARDDGVVISSGPLELAPLDAEARAQYRARLGELREQAEEAAARGDRSAAVSLDAEIRWLEHALREAYGQPHGRAGAFAQKARKAVYNRIRAAMDAIGQEHPTLGRHLRHSVRTGFVCAYQPEAPWEWRVADGSDA